MKVKLTGITSNVGQIHRPLVDLLNQISFPVIVKTDEFNFFVDLKQYIVDPACPDSLEHWSLEWFTYEEIKD